MTGAAVAPGPDSAGFWSALDQLVADSGIVIDRPAGSRHPRFPDRVYPLDYGYLAGTSAMDGGGIDLWRGTDPAWRLAGVILTVDLIKRDAEIKLLIGCRENEIATVLAFHNDSAAMKGVLVRRPDGEAGGLVGDEGLEPPTSSV